MKLGVNNNVNRESHKASLKLMVKPPNSHPSNPIHKQATEAQGLAVKKKPTQSKATDTPETQTLVTRAPATQTTITQPTQSTKTDSVDSHHVNKALVVVGALAFVGLIVYASS